MSIRRSTIRLAMILVCSSAIEPSRATGQSRDVPIPEELAALDFMIGSWTVDGAFRTPDHVGSDRTLWYLTSRGLTRFDGEDWVAFSSGMSSVADSILRQTRERSEPYLFTHSREASRIQEGFVLLIDDGETSGSTFVFYDSERSAWISTAIHAPSNAMTNALAPAGSGLPEFEGRGTDRRGERIFRRQYERFGEDHYRIRTDVSFDGGETWIEDQIVQDVRRRANDPSGPS